MFIWHIYTYLKPPSHITPKYSIIIENKFIDKNTTHYHQKIPLTHLKFTRATPNRMFGYSTHRKTLPPPNIFHESGITQKILSYRDLSLIIQYRQNNKYMYSHKPICKQPTHTPNPQQLTCSPDRTNNTRKLIKKETHHIHIQYKNQHICVSIISSINKLERYII